MMDTPTPDPYRIIGLDAEIDAEIAECERLEEIARTEEAIAELREATDLAYDEGMAHGTES